MTIRAGNEVSQGDSYPVGSCDSRVDRQIVEDVQPAIQLLLVTLIGFKPVFIEHLLGRVLSTIMRKIVCRQ